MFTLHPLRLWASAREDLPDPLARRVALLVVLLLCIAGGAEAQAQQVDTNQFVNVRPLPDTTWALRRVWGLNQDEFMIAAYLATSVPGQNIGALWHWTDSLGIPIIEYRSDLRYSALTDTLADSALGRQPDGTWRHRQIISLFPLSWVGYAREALFYPFDSAASFYWQCRFLDPRIDGQFPGYSVRNPLERDHRNDSTLERVYDTATTLPGATVAEHIAFAYDSASQIRRWKNGPWDDSVHNTSEFFSRNDLDISYDNRSMFVVVTAHLFDSSAYGRGYGVGLADTLLAIDVVVEVPFYGTDGKPTTYLNEAGQVAAVTADTAFVYATGFVTKQNLLPPIEDGVTLWNRYRSVPLLFDMKRADPNGPGGPFNDANSAHRMDVRVRWTGKEKLALRSIALRDTAAQLLLGDGAAAEAYRGAIIDSVERVLRGYTWNDPDDTAATNARLHDRLGKMIRLYTGDEGGGLRNVGYNWIDSVLYRRYGGGDSLTRGFGRIGRRPVRWNAMPAR